MRAFFGASSEGGLLVSLSENGEIFSVEKGPPTGDALALLDRALRKRKTPAKRIREIVVDRGPAGFSVVRRRVAAATGLARALDAKLCALEGGSPEEAVALSEAAFAFKQPIRPLYAAEPNITASPKKNTWNVR